MKKIFISHRSIDDDVCSFFKDMLVICGVKQEEILYTSAKENGLVYQITPEIKKAIKESLIDIIFLSPNYLESIYCCTEMGALAMKETPTIIFGIKGINYSNVEGLQGKEVYIRDFSNPDDLIQVVDIIEKNLGTMSSKSAANAQAKKVVDNYKRILEINKNSNSSNTQFSPDNLLKIINEQKLKIQSLENANKELNSKLNVNNSIEAMNDMISSEIILPITIGEKNKTRKIIWKDLFLIIFANHDSESINDSNIKYWIGNAINKNNQYNVSIYSRKEWKKDLEINDLFLQKYLQELITYNLVLRRGKHFSNYYELTDKGNALLNKIIKEKP